MSTLHPAFHPQGIDACSAGEMVAFGYMQDFAVIPIVIIPLLISRRQGRWVLYMRRLAFLCVCFLTTQTIRYSRCSLGSNLVIGIWSAYLAIWSGVFLVFRDFEECFMRVEEHVVMEDIQQSPCKDQTYTSSAAIQHEEPSTRKRHQQPTSTAPASQKVHLLRWQKYPDTLLHRFFWVLDMLLSLKGAGWNWGPSSQSLSLPRLLPSRTLDDRKNPLRALMLTSSLKSLALYLQMLLLQAIALRDPYFWGPYAPPSHQPALVPQSAFQRATRACLSAAMIWTSMALIASSLALAHTLITACIRSFRNKTGTVALESAWLSHADTLLLPDTDTEARSPPTPQTTATLEWFWGSFWHQTYRQGLVEASRWLLTPLAKTHIDRRFRTTVFRFLVFSLSGAIHWCGLYTGLVPGGGSPSWRPVLFFAVQPVGMFAVGWLRGLLLSSGRSERLWRVVDLGVTFAWLVGTAPWLLDELAWTGTWVLDVPGLGDVGRMVGLGG
ncbi:hypothetical protein P168DRAFT_278209 [Aspergillus campestris IBT 28561]|uniref:Wax synthase domain-containing protein n=1 Tax=Aspergillus campestris (strain IBT 28561) TaxID=1392248 RepID=A0A2I1DFI9_ASPC2|nr:uncharacterized protein P168DRAFT_278209 [Aspergillus campestris IBT 28561]PKY08645.1 hypothetical protein P168DRAFT_278209 [Aspergillus campestris IBT 28561]